MQVSYRCSCCHCLKAFPLPPLPLSLFSILSLFFLSHVIEWMNVWRRVFLFWEDKTGGAKRWRELRERGKERTSGGGGQVKEGVGEGKTGGGDLPFQPVSAQWLATCLCRWLRGDLWPSGWRASVAASALIREPHDWTLCRASDPPQQKHSDSGGTGAEGTTDARNDTHTTQEEGWLVKETKICWAGNKIYNICAIKWLN